MRNIILLALFLMLLVSEMFGLKIGITHGLSAKNMLLYILLGGIVIDGVVNKVRAPSILSIHLNFIILILIAFISWWITDINRPLINNLSKLERFFSLKGMLIDHYLFFLVFYYTNKTIPETINIIKLILILIFISTFITVIDVYDIPDLGIIKQMEHESAANRGRVQGPLGEPNQYAVFLVLFLPAYIGLGMYAGKKKIMFIVAGVVTFIVLLLTGSRGGILGLVSGAVIGIYSLKKSIDLKKIMGSLITLTVIASIGLSVVLYKYSNLILGRVDSTVNASSTTAASAGRLWIWEKGIDKMLDDPINIILGVGWDTYAGYVGIVSHNEYLTKLFELGILGLFSYLMIFYLVFKKIKKGILVSEDEQRIMLISFIFGYSGLLVSIFFVNLFNPWFFIWSYIGLCLRLSTLSQKKHKEKKDKLI